MEWWNGAVLLQAQGEASWQGVLVPFLVMFAIFYFLLIRPQQKQQRKRQEMLANLRRGDKVVTVGGIHGEITGLKDDEVTVRIADKVEIRMNRSAIGYVKGDKNS